LTLFPFLDKFRGLSGNANGTFGTIWGVPWSQPDLFEMLVVMRFARASEASPAVGAYRSGGAVAVGDWSHRPQLWRRDFLRKVLLFSPWDTWAAARLPARMQLL